MTEQYVYLPKDEQDKIQTLVLWLAKWPARIRLAVWHISCTNGPVEFRPLLLGLPPGNWRCPNCRVTDILRKDLRYSFVLKVEDDDALRE